MLTLQATGGAKLGPFTVPVLTGYAQFLQTKIVEIFSITLGVNQKKIPVDGR